MHMQKMGKGDGAEQKPFSVSFNKLDSRKNVWFDNTASSSSAGGSMRSNIKDDYAITLAISEDDILAVHSVETPEGVDMDDPESTLLGKDVEKRSSFRKLVARSASARIIRHLSGELKKLASWSKPPIVDQSEPILGQSGRTKSAAIYALTQLNFITTEEEDSAKKKKGPKMDPWEAAENRFKELTKNTVGLLPRALFGKCIGMKEDSYDFAGELFDALSRRQNYKGYLINKTQMKEFWDQIVDKSFDSRLQIFFDMVDKDANGQISKDEVQEIISLSASTNKLLNIHTQADEYATMIMEELDRDGHGYILIDELKRLLLQAPEDSKTLSIMLSKDLNKQEDSNIIQRGYNHMKYFLQDKWQRIWVLSLWVGIMAGLFTYKYIQYKNRAAYDVMGHCVSIAKGAAETLKLNMALILLPVCRNTITWLRNKTKLGVVVPFAYIINFHQLIAFGIAIGTGLHAISHLACDFPRLLAATEEEYEPMVQYFGEQPNTYWHFVRGTEGWTGIAMVVLMAIAFTLATPRLRNGNLERPKIMKSTLFNAFWKLVVKITGFNSFWYSHHLFIIVYGMLIVHGIKLYLTKEWYKKTTWMYLAVPVLLYACERLTRAIRSRVKPVKILKAALHGVYTANMLELRMSKPPGFKYRSGQYMFVNCKAVAPFEWHPFSITSAPGDDYLSVHIRMLGDWTKQLKNVFFEASQRPTNGKSGPPKVKIDGPYGAPAQDYEKYDIVLLVGTGIGATPMVSIVKDIVNNMKAKQKEVEALESGGNTSLPPASPLSKKSASNFKTTRAYFYWVTREQGSFDRFKDVFDEFAEAGYDNVIEMHNHCTSVYEKDDARAALITMLQSLTHKKNGVDVVSGTQLKSHFGKPDWDRVFRKIVASHTGQRIGVFFCGAPSLGIDLKNHSSQFSRTTTTTFEFHKEIF